MNYSTLIDLMHCFDNKNVCLLCKMHAKRAIGKRLVIFKRCYFAL